MAVGNSCNFRRQSARLRSARNKSRRLILRFKSRSIVVFSIFIATERKRKEAKLELGRGRRTTNVGRRTSDVRIVKIFSFVVDTVWPYINRRSVHSHIDCNLSRNYCVEDFWKKRQFIFNRLHARDICMTLYCTHFRVSFYEKLLRIIPRGAS